MIKKIYQSANYAISGIKSTLKHEFMPRIQLGFSLIQLILGLLLGFDLALIMIIIIMSTILFAMELMNTAIENVCDLITYEDNIIIKRAKDSAAGAVFIISVLNWILFILFTYYTLI